LRHGEVENPRHLVYADLPGFHLSARGRAQAAAAGEHLALGDVSRIVSSPLDRATETAKIVAAACGVPVEIDDDLTEWRLSVRWSGVVWEEVPDHFPGELETYLERPEDITFGPESLDQLAARMRRAVAGHTDVAGVLVLVSHQDPVQAARLYLTGRSWRGFQSEKPGHASIVTLHGDGAGRWTETGYWEPEQGGNRFPPPRP
jgi:broad specificity phosphatase PhoE